MTPSFDQSTPVNLTVRLPLASQSIWTTWLGRLNNVTDDQFNTLDTAPATMGLLLGDVDGDGTVTKADFVIEKADQGQTTNSNSFRADINVNGSIDG